MKLNKIEIANFGKLSDYTLNFNDNLQIILGNNEDGKSTVMAFILLMFYSDHGRSRVLDQMPRQLYAPWNGAVMEGALELSYEGNSYRLQKTFGDTPSKDKTVLINLDSGENVPLPRNEEAGEYFFGLNLSSFKRSSFINQIGGFIPTKDADNIAEKLIANLVTSGEEEFSQQEIIARLEKAKYDLISKRGDKGRLVAVETSLNQVKKEEQEIKSILEQQRELSEEYELVKKDLSRLELLGDELDLLKQISQKNSIEKLMDQKGQLKDLEQKLQDKNMSLADAQQLINNSEEALDSYQGEWQTLNALKQSNSSEVLITELEYNEYTDLNKKNAIVFAMVNRNKNSLLPALTSYKELTSEAIIKEDDLAKSKENYMQNLQPKEQALNSKKLKLLDQQQLKEQKTESINQSFSGWNLQREEKQLEIKKAKDTLDSIVVTARPNVPLLIAGIAIVLLSLAAAFFIDPIAALGVALGGLLIIISLIKRKYTNLQEKSLAESRLNELSHNLDDWEVKTKESQHALEDDLVKITDEIARLNQGIDEIKVDFDYESFKELEKHLHELSASLGQTKFKAETAEKNYNTIRCEILEQLKEENIRIDSTNEDLTDALTSLLNRNARTIAEILVSKKSKSPADFEKEYLNSKTIQKNLELIRDKENGLKVVENKFLSLLKDHGKYLDFANGKALILGVKATVQSIDEITAQVNIAEGALGMNSSTIKSLREHVAKINNTNTQYAIKDIPELEKELGELKDKGLMDTLKSLQSRIQTPERTLEDVSEEISLLEDSLSELYLHYNGASMALDVMEASSEELRQSFGDTVNERTGEIFSALTGEKYSGILVNQNYDIKFKSGSHYREWQYLSNGTIDQAYLALRLAVSELIAEDSSYIPLFLDDMLIQYDDTRAETTLQYLKNYSQEKNVQIILFSCHGRMKAFATELNIAFKNLQPTAFNACT